MEMLLALHPSLQGVYISQLIRFARASSYITDFNTRNRLLTQKLLKQGYWYHKLRKTFSKFYRRYYGLISKFQVGLKYEMVGPDALDACLAHRGLPVGFPLLRYSVLFTVEPLSLLPLLFIS